MHGVTKILDSGGNEVQSCEQGGRYSLFTEYQSITIPIQSRFERLAEIGGFTVEIYPSNADATENAQGKASGKSSGRGKRSGKGASKKASAADA